MSTFILRHIDITLDPESIDKAIEQIDDLRYRLKPAMEHLVAHLAEKGEEVAKAMIIYMDPAAYYTGELYDTIRHEAEGENGKVLAGVPGGRGFYAAYVEFGTGIYNAGGRQDGWVYFNDRDSRFHFTRGFHARPFMQATYTDMIEYAESMGGQIVAEYINREMGG